MSDCSKSVKFGKCEQCEQKKHSDKVEKHCKGCVCDQLRQLVTPTRVNVFLSGGQVLENLVFISLDQKSCCAFFSDSTTDPSSTIIVDCQDIQALRIEVS